MKERSLAMRGLLLLSTALPMLSSGALAQAPAAPATAATPPAIDSDTGDIVVTARKRDETSLAVPVVVSAVGMAELSRRAVNSLDGIARIVPQLLIAPQGGSVQGGNIAIRGISGPDTNPFGDQAVSFNVDGVQVAKANIRRMADTDIQQVEVLKGPQALFFGKNSPAGIVSIRTADPTRSLEAKVSTGYEFEAREIRTEGYVSTPLSDTLGARLSGYYSHMQGYLKDQTPDNSPYNPEHERTPRSRDFAVRGTLKWEPDDQFNARLKVNYAQTKNAGPQAGGEFVSCPTGVRQTGSPAQCKPGKYNTNASSGPFVGTLPGTLNTFGDGQNYQNQKQILGGLELNYHLTDQITLTSVTGYYYVKLRQCQNYESDYSIILPSCNPSKDRELSQELRMVTDYDGPLNFSGGVYYANTRAETGSITYLFGGAFDLFPAGSFGPGSPALGGPTTPLLVNDYFLVQKGTAYSAYLQLIYKPVDTVEIDVGGRYSYEKKRVPVVRSSATAFLDASNEIMGIKRRDSWNDFSPEVTISYRPTQKLTFFGSYKHGFLSGGFNSSSVAFAPGLDISYDPQTIKGFEAGAKLLTLGNALRINAAAYTYKVSDLQVTNFTNATATIRNAGAVSIKGFEFDFAYKTPLEGLSLNGAAAYNHGKYTSFPGAPCYNGQTPAQGCNIINGNPTQDLGGTELIRAPKWNLSGGFNYETPIGSSLKFGLTGAATYSSSFLTDASSAPQGRQPKYTLLDASVRVGDANDRWELAAIGRNLSNKHYFVASPNVPFTGGGAGTAAGVLGDRFAVVSRGRELMLRVSYKFGQ